MIGSVRQRVISRSVQRICISKMPCTDIFLVKAKSRSQCQVLDNVPSSPYIPHQMAGQPVIFIGSGDFLGYGTDGLSVIKRKHIDGTVFIIDISIGGVINRTVERITSDVLIQIGIHHIGIQFQVISELMRQGQGCVITIHIIHLHQTVFGHIFKSQIECCFLRTIRDINRMGHLATRLHQHIHPVYILIGFYRIISRTENLGIIFGTCPLAIRAISLSLEVGPFRQIHPIGISSHGIDGIITVI